MLSAPSGAGKTTLAHALLDRLDNIVQTVSWTTREPRPQEVDGRHYRFVDQKTFDEHRQQGGFLESALVHGNSYGTPCGEVDRILAAGDDALMVIDVQGAAQVRGKFADAVMIFVLPPSRSVLEERLGVAAEEIAKFVRYHYVVINDDFEQALRELEAIVVAESCRRRHRTPAADEILESFR